MYNNHSYGMDSALICVPQYCIFPERLVSEKRPNSEWASKLTSAIGKQSGKSSYLDKFC